MHERKEGTLKSGRSGKTVTSKKQATAIGLSEARKEGAQGSQEKIFFREEVSKERSSKKSSKN